MNPTPADLRAMTHADLMRLYGRLLQDDDLTVADRAEVAAEVKTRMDARRAERRAARRAERRAACRARQTMQGCWG